MLKRYVWAKNIVFLCLFAFMAAQISNKIILARLSDAPNLGSTTVTPDRSRPKETKRRSLRQYRVISRRNIFNSESVGKGESTTSSPKPKSSEPLKQTELNVRLIGTVVGPPETSFAIIEDKHSRKQELYQIDDMILDQARVLEIARCKVVVLRDNQEEVLICPEEGDKDGGRSAYVASKSAKGVSGDTANVKKISETDYMIDEMEVENALNNINQLMTQIRVVPNFQDGKANGFKVFAIKPKSIFAKIGLKNGDVIQKINDMDITSPDRAFQAFQELKDEKSLSVELLRRGGPISLHYEIR